MPPGAAGHGELSANARRLPAGEISPAEFEELTGGDAGPTRPDPRWWAGQ
ncbi:hypothetical protein U2F26_19790 [Micromonospora sp. 4G57]|uniref:Uncharacterized protein n=1 Tax=Micromonospora sicca TaxID=2202420 RepID=A0ABU5J5T4_9ACTN|nr:MULTISPECIES: hypothetical protein [unclassified Micromonospora]MDZ5444961.1 hypothetical protein [Micromonospora sp. 4G57]MDZ5487879.1 hypothetical protein [Micromonospora sp. 4G53]